MSLQAEEYQAYLALERWGIRTLGELAALPPGEVFERLGLAGSRLQQLARGEDRRPLVSPPDAPVFEASLVLEWPIEGVEPLSFVLGRLFEPLCTKLERWDRGVATLHVRLKLVTRELHVRTLELPSPLRDPRVLRTLVLLDLESHPPWAGIDEVAVRVDPTPGRIVQGSLIDRPLPVPERLSTLLARLYGLMGEGRCGSPVLPDTHAPGAVRLAPFTGEERRDRGQLREWPREDRPSDGRAVLRRFRLPVLASVQVAHGRPVHLRVRREGLPVGSILACAGPWRTSGHWWAMRADPPGVAAWDRDEWEVAVTGGGIYRIYHDRLGDRWFVEGAID